jgi:hypothetical protein
LNGEGKKPKRMMLDAASTLGTVGNFVYEPYPR